ncbi:tetratricopeptide repeat protein [Ideonella azotifigens]|uniref:Tetratricopeptide repeat protein n=1 Tax=Ideonella azotifigens TaxID=513160 RepID=A0ABP3VJ95_9BURK|nr:tetratricopeptide repeat protein [Ideonella azotifigens]MCD2344055.1 tetratricopeptide repeat protein [Ideonella azotifigens]
MPPPVDESPPPAVPPATGAPAPIPTPVASQLRDARDQRLGTASREAADRAETALWRMMSFSETPLADLDAAIAADPGWGLPRIMKAGYLLGLTEASQLAPARQLLDQAEPLQANAPERERAHLEALRAIAEGRWQLACRRWDALLLEHPRDALALQWAHQWDYLQGDTASLRSRPAQVLPEWDEADPLFPQVLGLYASGLEENNCYPQAEDAGRRAVAGGASVPWAVHAVAHVLHMSGRLEDGNAWLRQHQPNWAEGNAFASHLWWHMGLFRLEALDLPGAHRLLDAHFSGDMLQSSFQQFDAVSLLWRMHLMGEDVSARFVELLRGWSPPASEAGHRAFTDLHVTLACIGAGELLQAEGWLARCAERAMQPEDVRRSNHTTAREVGLPLMRGLLALAKGDPDAAVQQLHAVRPQLRRLGGSHLQRDLLDQTLMAAAAQARHAPIGRALLNECLMAKPVVTPLTRHWAGRLHLDI